MCRCFSFAVMIMLCLAGSAVQAGAVVTRNGKVTIGPARRDGKDVLVKLKYGVMRYKEDKILWATISSRVRSRYTAGKLALKQKNLRAAEILFRAAAEQETANRQAARQELKRLAEMKKSRRERRDLEELEGTEVAATDEPEDEPEEKKEVDLESSAMYQATKGDLVAVKGKSLRRYDAKDLGGAEFYAFYYSASWCGPCRAFTPKLVKAYEELKKEHGDRFELVFVCFDRSEKAMEDYMLDSTEFFGHFFSRKMAA